jgi:succinyl-CoA synthetase beta subunit
MQIHEYQAKLIMRNYGLSVPDGFLANSPEEALQAAKNINSDFWVVKAQVHAGGRGKAGGVKLAKTMADVESMTSDMIGMKLVNEQTGAEGKIVHKVYVEASSQIKKEYYLSLVLDRARAAVAIIASTEGGMDIEEVAANNPEKIITIFVDPVIGLQGFHLVQLGFGLGLSKEKVKKLSKVVKGLYKLFVDKNATQVEINPLIEDEKEEFHILDAKLDFDDNALYKLPDIEEMRDPLEENPEESKAKEYDLSYIKMSGEIGCMVNGAGLAMATMDIIKLHGKEPANFLDVGGGATKEKVTHALKIILSDSNVKGILVNIFGGIMKCDIIAEGVVSAAKDVNIEVPLVVRLEGTNSELGKKILKESGLQIIAADDLEDAAKKISQEI